MTQRPLQIPALSRRSDEGQIRHVRVLPARSAAYAPWPEWLDPRVQEKVEFAGIPQPYSHQRAASDLAHSGTHTVVATGTASGKSLAYLLPTLHEIAQNEKTTVLYLSPTKALAADQRQAIESLATPGLRVSSYDSDTPVSERAWVRDYANFVLSNPDMLHFGILPNHERWSRFLGNLAYVVVDEAHSYRGVFGSHVAMILRRLRRVCAQHGSQPTFIAASATIADPAAAFSTLIGAPVQAVTEDGSAHGATEVVLWEPELSDYTDENDAPRRRSAIAVSASMMADLAVEKIRTLAFIRSRRGAELISLFTKDHLAEVAQGLDQKIAAYRSGYLPEERREVERRLRDGDLLGVAATNALELGIDISGLDAIVVAGWPGTRASFFQQIGRAGRAGQDSTAVLIASDDPLDTYLVNHPQAIFDTPMEQLVMDPSNPYVAGPQLCAAAAEFPITEADNEFFAPEIMAEVDSLVSQGLLRRRLAGWYWTHQQSPAAMVSIRGAGGAPMSLIDTTTGALLGTMDASLSHFQAHPGAVYTHQGETFLVDELREDENTVLLHRESPDFYTQARDITEVEVLEELDSRDYQGVRVHFGKVKVRTHVITFLRKSLASHEIVGEEPLELDAQELFTKAVWYTIDPEKLSEWGVSKDVLPGALHASEHAGIGLLPLLASSDRWDIGGVSTALHVDTGKPSVFVYDGHPGGAGFAERAYQMFHEWVVATLGAVSSCECEKGCPSCIQSPKCGNRNNPLDKAAAMIVLGALSDLTMAES